VGRWSRRLSGNTPGPGTERDPAGGPAGQPRAQALGTVAGPDVRPDRAVQAASAFPGWHPGRPCRQGSRPGLCCSTLQGRSVGVSPSAKMCAFSQGLRPGLSCATLSGSSAFSIRVSSWQASETSWQASETSDKRHRSWVAADCRPSAPHQGFTGTRQAVHSHSVTCGQQSALCEAGQCQAFQACSIILDGRFPDRLGAGVRCRIMQVRHLPACAGFCRRPCFG
jgi:hypothetical protein